MLAFLVGLSILGQCPTPEVDNRTATWNQLDRETYARAVGRCAFYFKGSPCLKRLIKLEDRRYHAVCGKGEQMPLSQNDLDLR